MLIFLGIVCALGYRREFHKHNSTRQQLRLPLFGFDTGGRAVISIAINIPSSLYIFLMSAPEYARVRAGVVYLPNICKRRDLNFSVLNFSSPKPVSDVLWKTTVEHAGIYAPVVVNCAENRTTIYDVRVKFRNKDSLLDSREKGIDVMYCIMSFMYLVLGVVWIWNLVSHLKYCIVIHNVMCFVPLLKAVSLAVSAALWQEKKVTDEPRSVLVYADCIAFMMFCIAYTLSFLVAASGYGVFRSTLTTDELVAFLFTTIWLSFGLAFADFFADPDYAVFGRLVVAILGLYYIQILVNCWYSVMQLQLMATDGVMVLKSFMVAHFVAMSLVFFVILVVLDGLGYLFGMWKNMMCAVLEMCVFNSVAFQGSYMIRSDHAYQEDVVEEAGDIRSLHEPDSVPGQLVFVKV